MSDPLASARSGRHRASWRAYGASLALVAATAAAAAAIEQLVNLPDDGIFFVPAILYSATRWGLGPSLSAAAASLLAYTFFFMEPRYTLAIETLGDAIAVTVFASVAVVTSNLAHKIRRQAAAALAREQRTAILYELSRAVAGIDELETLGARLVERIAACLGGPAALWVEPAPGAAPALLAASDRVLAERDAAVVAALYSAGAPAARGHASGAGELYPLTSEGRIIGALAVAPAAGQAAADPGLRALTLALADLAAAAVARLLLSREVERTRQAAEAERLRTALLNSVSHDLRTPLAAITGTVTTLLSEEGRFSDESRRALLETVGDEAFRLDRLVGNLLDMARWQAGAVALKVEWVEVADIVAAALRHLRHAVNHVAIERDIPVALPMIRVDEILTEHALLNLVDNAAKHSPPGGVVRIAASRRGGDVVISVDDQGPGVPAALRGAVFESFQRGAAGDRVPSGSGLGLAICKAFVEAQGGRVTVGDSGLGGARFELIFPAPAAMQESHGLAGQ